MTHVKNATYEINNINGEDKTRWITILPSQLFENIQYIIN